MKESVVTDELHVFRIRREGRELVGLGPAGGGPMFLVDADGGWLVVMAMLDAYPALAARMLGELADSIEGDALVALFDALHDAHPKLQERYVRVTAPGKENN